MDLGNEESTWPAGTHYFTQVTPDDHQGPLYIITLLSFVYVLMAFCIRFLVKYGAYSNDDWALLTSTILAVGQYTAMLIGLSEGLGRSSQLLSVSQRSMIAKYYQAHVFLFFLAHAASKLSTALLIRRLFENGRQREQLLCSCLVAMSALYGVVCVILAAIKCPNSADAESGDHSCSNRFVRWQLILALDILTELLLVTVPLALILDNLVQRSAKLTVTVVFAFRLVDIVFAALNLRQVKLLERSTDYSLDIVPAIIWTQTELLWSIISASLPCLKQFMRPFDKVDQDNWRSSNNMYSSSKSGRSWTTRRAGAIRDSVPLEDVVGHTDGNVISASRSDRIMPFRPDHMDHDFYAMQIAANNSPLGNPRKTWR